MPAADFFAMCAPGAPAPVEFANAARLDAYMDNGLKPTTFIAGSACLNDGQLRDLVGQICNTPTPSYETPATDNAPWYDPLIPESAGFAGVLVTKVEGLDKAPIDRAVTRRVNGGAAIGPMRYTERVLDFEIQLIGSSCCSVAYGYRWLTAMLQGCCSDGCELPDLKFLESIPRETAQTYCAPGLDAGVLTVPNESNRNPWRTLHQVALMEGPEVVERRGTGCGCGCTPVMTVEFALVAGLPWIYSDPVEVVAPTTLLDGGELDCDNPNYVWRFCETAVNCDPTYPGYDPQCATPPAPPAPVPPALSCFCEPLAYREKSFTFTSAAPDWFEQSAIITVENTSADPLRNLTVRFAQTNAGCIGLTDCDWCSSLGVEYIPPFSKLIIDSARRLILLETNGNFYNAERAVVSAIGTPFSWIDIACGTYCVKIESDAFNTPVTATVGIEVATKEL